MSEISRHLVKQHSAVHVVKGAIVRVLGGCTTTSVHVDDDHARLTVRTGRKPNDEELRRVEQEANRKIAENAEVLQFEMERQEAEGHFGPAIYDAFPVPKVDRLTIVRIPDWEVNCCVAEHVEGTGELLGIKVDGWRFRKAKGLLEMEFHILG